MTTTVTRRYHFEAAHFLPNVPDTHRCKRMHGHNYEFDVTIAGSPDERGFLLDFYELDNIVKPNVIDIIDHRTLNDINGLKNPTAELIAEWIATTIAGFIPRHLRLSHVRVYETKDCWADYHI